MTLDDPGNAATAPVPEYQPGTDAFATDTHSQLARAEQRRRLQSLITAIVTVVALTAGTLGCLATSTLMPAVLALLGWLSLLILTAGVMNYRYGVEPRPVAGRAR